MSKFIHNISGSTKIYQGIEILNEAYFEIPQNLYLEFALDSNVASDILSGDICISRNGVSCIENANNAIALIKMQDLRSSLAVDKNGINQQINDDTPTKITADRVLWDVSENYNVAQDCIDIPYDAIYSFDCQVKLTNITNCSFIELAIYKKLENGEDYWFILDRKATGTSTEIQMNGATQFDFYEGEQYELRIILTKSLPLIGCSCTISGDDDFTAWGFNLSDLL